jgi:hypothetical protein
VSVGLDSAQDRRERTVFGDEPDVVFRRRPGHLQKLRRARGQHVGDGLADPAAAGQLFGGCGDVGTEIAQGDP